jgi:excisionase family DNA binding protein
MAAEIPFTQRITCTIPEACNGTGLGRSKIYEMMDAGAIQSTKQGKRRLIIVRSLVKLLDPQAEQAA